MTLLNGITLSASLIAVITSIAFALRQSRLMRQANQMPAALDLIYKFYSPEFVREERAVWASLGSEAAPEQGFSGMSDELHDHVYRICAYYQMVAYLVGFGMLDKRLAILPHHYRVIKTWSIVEPYVKGERDLRGDQYSFFNCFEDFALMCTREPSARSQFYIRNRKAGLRWRLRRSAELSKALVPSPAAEGLVASEAQAQESSVQPSAAGLAGG
jgi:hypothetical protein